MLLFGNHILNKATLGEGVYSTAVEARMLFMSRLLFWDGKSSRILRHGLCMASEVASSFQSKQETDLQPPRARHRNAHFFQSGLLLFGLLPFSMLIKAIDAVCISHHLCHTYQGLWYILTWCILEPKYIKVPTTRSTSTQEGKQIFNNVIQRTYNLGSCYYIKCTLGSAKIKGFIWFLNKRPASGWKCLSLKSNNFKSKFAETIMVPLPCRLMGYQISWIVML